MSNKSNKKKEAYSFIQNIKSLNTKYKNEIIWNTLPINEYIEYINSIDIYNDITTNLNINIKEYKDYEIIGFCEINKNLRFVGDFDEHMYLITDSSKKKLYISIGKCHPIFWYLIKSESEFTDNFDNIYETYNQEGYHLHHTKKIRAFMGTNELLSLDVFDIETHLLLHKYSEKLLWGSKWKDFPYRNNYLVENVSQFDSNIFTSHAMQQDYKENTYNISVRSKYSKSVITFYYHEDAYIVEIKYNPLHTNQIMNINKDFNRSYDNDIPIDVVLMLFNFPFIKFKDIIEMKPFLNFHFYIINLLISDDKELLKTIGPELQKLLNDQPDIEDNLKKEIIDFIKYTKDIKVIEEILTEIKDLIYNDKEVKLEDLLQKYKCTDNDYVKNCLDYYLK